MNLRRFKVHRVQSFHLIQLAKCMGEFFWRENSKFCIQVQVSSKQDKENRLLVLLSSIVHVNGGNFRRSRRIDGQEIYRKVNQTGRAFKKPSCPHRHGRSIIWKSYRKSALVTLKSLWVRVTVTPCILPLVIQVLDTNCR